MARTDARHHAGRVAERTLAWGRALHSWGIAGTTASHTTLRARSTRHTGVLTLTLLAGVLTGCDAAQPLDPAPRAPVNAAVGTAGTSRGTPVPDQWIVTFRDDVSDVPGLARSMVRGAGGTLRFTYTAAIKGFAASLPPQALDGIRRNPHVKSLEQDMVVTGEDVQGGATWGLDRSDQRLKPLDSQYTYANTGAGVTVYIIDTGIRSTHVQFGGRVAAGYTGVNDGWGTEDCAGHGTHVAGTVGSALYGIAKGVTLVPVRVLDCNGSGTSSLSIAGLDWVVKQNRRPAVVNMSLGGAASSSFTTAVQNATNAGVVVVVSAGNSSTDACTQSPASAPTAITVGALGMSDEMAYFSNYGKCVDLFAPGYGIQSTSRASDTSSTYMSGTSMASPHVAGAAALYLAANPTATPAQVSDALTSNATPDVITSLAAGTANKLLFTGFIGAGSAPAPAPAPSPTPTTPPDTTSTSTPTPVNSAPTASFTVTCTRGSCAFDAGSSTDDAGVTQYRWTFGEGSAGVSLTTPLTQYRYTKTGTFTVTLTVVDAAGLTGTRSTSLRIRKL